RNVDLRQVRRQARAEARPGRPAVGRLDQAARGALELVLVLPGAETRLPQRRIHDLRLQRIDGDRGTAGVLIAVQNPLPADSGVRCSSKTGCQVRPASSVFQTPPSAAPT